MNSKIELCAFELSGRGGRYDSPLYTSVNEIVEDTYEQIKYDLDTSDYAFWGHSLGSLIAYELAYKVYEESGTWPNHIFFSGSKAPHIDRTNDPIHTLPYEKFKEKLFEIGGTPKEIFESQELLDILIPILRADFCANDRYAYKDKPCKIGCNISVINSKKDDISLNDMVGWRTHTNGQCKIHVLDGDHFFINSNYREVINIINSSL